MYLAMEVLVIHLLQVQHSISCSCRLVQCSLTSHLQGDEHELVYRLQLLIDGIELGPELFLWGGWSLIW